MAAAVASRRASADAGPDFRSDQQEFQKLVLGCNKEGMDFLRKGQHKQAFEQLKYAEAMLGERQSEDEPTNLLAVTCNNLGCYYKKVGKLHAALSYLRKSLKIEVNLQTDDVTVAGTHLNICAILSKLDKHDKAVQHAACALELISNRINAAGDAASQDDYSVLAIAYHNVAVERDYLQQWDQAAAAYQQGHQVARRCLGDQHPLTQALAKNCETAQQKSQKLAPVQKQAAPQQASSARGPRGGSRPPPAPEPPRGGGSQTARGPRDPAGQAAQPGSRLPEIPGASGGRARAQEAGAELPPLPAPARVPAAQALPAELQEAPGAPRQPQDPNGGQIEWARQTTGSPASRPGAEAQAVPQQAAPGPPRELPPIQQPLQAAAPPPQPLQQPEQQLHHPPELQHQATQQQQPIQEQAPVQQQQTLRQQQQQPQQHVEPRRSQAAAARAGASPDAAREQTPKRASVAAVEDLGPSNMAATRAGSPPPLLVMGRDGRERRSKVSDMPSTMNPQDEPPALVQVNGRRVNRGAGLGAVAGQLRDRATENAAVGKAKRTKVEDGAGHDAESRLLRRTMIMKIQAAWRQYIRSKKSAKEAEQARHRAATRIQARWRAWIVRHRKRAKAAIAIQRVVRGFTLRLKAKRRKAAITIQRHFLGNIERRRLKKLHRAATEIQARFRGTGQRKRYQMLRMKTKHAVEVLHGFYHLIQAKKRFNALLAESNAEAEKQAAAVSIQKVFRAHKSRQSTMELRLKVRGDERHLRAVLTVQAFVRRKAAQRVMQRMRKNKIQELSNAATRIRAHWLKYMHLKRYRELRAEFKTHVPSVLVLQRYARGYLVRMRMWRDAIRAEEELWAAVEIQRCWRGYCGRLKWEMEYETVWSREAAVRRLQRHVRGWLSRTRAHRIRKRRARADFERARRRFKAAQRIQALARGRAGRRRVAELRGRKDQAATTVQRIFRGRRKRIEMRHQVVDRRTTQIQALARGFLVRRRRARFEAKVIFIQRFWRAHLRLPEDVRAKKQEKARARRRPAAPPEPPGVPAAEPLPAAAAGEAPAGAPQPEEAAPAAEGQQAPESPGASAERAAPR